MGVKFAGGKLATMASSMSVLQPGPRWQAIPCANINGVGEYLLIEVERIEE